jgi:hypothetical protein
MRIVTPPPALLAGRNRLLAALSRDDRRHLFDRCEPVDLNFGEVLSQPGDRIRQVHFPTGSFISLLQPIDGHDSLEVGLVGDEGMLGISLVLGVAFAPLRALVQGAGTALRMDAGPFSRELAHRPGLQKLLQR